MAVQDYTFRDPDTGETVTLRGDGVPSEADIEAAFAQKRANNMPVSEKVGRGTLGLGRKAVDAAKGAWGAIKGDAAEDLPNVNQAGMGGFQTSVASMFGSDADYAASLESQGYQITEDENGNTIAVGPDGKRAYVNQPGLDMEDAARFLGKTLSYLPAAKLSGMFARWIPRLSATSAGVGATEYGMEQVAEFAGGQPVDWGQVALAAGSGAVAESLAPILSRGWQAVKGKFQGAPTAEEGRQILIAAGAPAEEVSGLADDMLVRIAERGRNAGADVRPEAIAAEAEGYRPTRAQQTDTGWREHQRAMETTEGQFLDTAQRAQAQERAEGLAQSIGGQGPRSADEAAQDAMQGLRNEAARRGDEVDAAYAAAREMGEASVTPEAFSGLRQRLGDWVTRNRITDSDAKRRLYPGSTAAKEELTEIFSDLDDLIAQGADFRAPFDELEEVRRSLSAIWQAGANPADRRKIKLLQREYDAWLDDVFDRRLIEGDPEYIDAIKNARGYAKRYAEDFGERWQKKGKDSIGAKIEQFVDEGMDIDQGVEAFLGVSQLNIPAARSFAKRMKDVLPQESWDSFREAAFRRMISNRSRGGDQPLGFDALVAGLERVTGTGQASSLFRVLLTPDEFKNVRGAAFAMKGLQRASEITKKQGILTGAGDRAISAIEARLGGLPVLRVIPEVLRANQTRRYANPRLQRRREAGAVTAGTAVVPAMADEDS